MNAGARGIQKFLCKEGGMEILLGPALPIWTKALAALVLTILLACAAHQSINFPP